MFGKIKRVHFVGIGGIGMSGIAELLINLGFHVTGSDVQSSETIDRLRTFGASVTEGHREENIRDCDVVIYSSAVRKDNVELEAARRRGTLVVARAEMLGELLKLKLYSVAVAGTHGKTTTTSMVGSVLTEGGLDPTLVVGGVVKSLRTNAVLGAGEVIVVEADEFDRSFLKLQPTYALITNIDLDHMECYRDLADLKGSFAQFANSTPFYGFVVACADDPLVADILPAIRRPLLTYGLAGTAEFTARAISHHEIHSAFEVWRKNTRLGRLNLHVPGLHNVKNALAVTALAMEMDIPFETIRRGLDKFMGVRRRFEIKGIFNDIMVVDDYAHHPTEVAATLSGARAGWNRRLVCVFQPHLYSRTRDLADDFARAFQASDILLVTEVFPSREQPIPGITGKLIADKAAALGHANVHWIPGRSDLIPRLNEVARPGDLVLTLGAGDIWRTCNQYAASFTAAVGALA